MHTHLLLSCHQTSFTNDCQYQIAECNLFQTLTTKLMATDAPEPRPPVWIAWCCPSPTDRRRLRRCRCPPPLAPRGQIANWTDCSDSLHNHSTNAYAFHLAGGVCFIFSRFLCVMCCVLAWLECSGQMAAAVVFWSGGAIVPNRDCHVETVGDKDMYKKSLTFP